MKLILVLLMTLTCNFSAAETYIQINGVSIHDKPGFNGFNYGLGIEQSINNNWSVAGGWFRNSDYRGSAYAYARYALYKNGLWDIGVSAGVATGYDTYTVAPGAFPEVCYGYFCVIALPQVQSSGASALAAHLRIPIN